MTNNRANNPQSFMGQYAQSLADRGYGIIPIQPGTKKPGQKRGGNWYDFSRWSDRCGHRTSELELATWLGWDDAGIGLVCGQLAVIDIDVLDQEIAIKLEALAKRILGDTPLLRIGRAPKRALVYRVEVSFKGFKKHPIEVHCHGQQIVAFGIHPDTGTEYQWPDGNPVDIDIEDIPVITQEMARQFVEEAYALIPDSLKPTVLAFKGGGDARAQLEGKRTEGGTIEAVTAALGFIPNDNLAYSDWLRIGQSIKAGLGEQGRALWEAWSATSSKDHYATTVRTWRSLNPTQITVGTIYRLAQDAGWAPSYDVNLHADYDPLAVNPGQGILDRANARVRIELEPRAPEPQPAPEQTFKPMPKGWDNVGGVLEQMMRLIVDTAYRPQPELALGASIAAVAVLMGRRYRAENGARPNVYVVGVGKSGSGKNHARNVIGRLFDQAGVDRYLGASKIASGSGLIKALTAQPAQLYMLDEFGQFLQGVTDRKKSPKHVIEICDLFLELYTSSDGIYRGTDFAGGGATERKREAIVNPGLCLYGTTTSGHLWQALSESSRDDGSLARYLIFATSHDYPDENEYGGNFECPPGLVDQLALIANGGVRGGNLSDIELASVAPRCKPVPLSPAARAVFSDLGKQITKELNSPSAAGNESILARIKENASKLAHIRAVSREAVNPFVEIHDAEWGILTARHSAELLIKESSERISENVVEANLKRVLRIIREAGPAGVSRYRLTQQTRFIMAKGRNEILFDLIEANQIEYLKMPGSTKPTDIFRSI